MEPNRIKPNLGPAAQSLYVPPASGGFQADRGREFQAIEQANQFQSVVLSEAPVHQMHDQMPVATYHHIHLSHLIKGNQTEIDREVQNVSPINNFELSDLQEAPTDQAFQTIPVGIGHQDPLAERTCSTVSSKPVLYHEQALSGNSYEFAAPHIEFNISDARYGQSLPIERRASPELHHEQTHVRMSSSDSSQSSADLPNFGYRAKDSSVAKPTGHKASREVPQDRLPSFNPSDSSFQAPVLANLSTASEMVNQLELKWREEKASTQAFLYTHRRYADKVWMDWIVDTCLPQYLSKPVTSQDNVAIRLGKAVRTGVVSGVEVYKESLAQKAKEIDDYVEFRINRLKSTTPNPQELRAQLSLPSPVPNPIYTLLSAGLTGTWTALQSTAMTLWQGPARSPA